MLHTATANTPVRKDCEDSNLPWVSVHVAYQHAHNLMLIGQLQRRNARVNRVTFNASCPGFLTFAHIAASTSVTFDRLFGCLESLLYPGQ